MEVEGSTQNRGGEGAPGSGAAGLWWDPSSSSQIDGH